MKESEAKTKKCPILKNYCDASECVMWEPEYDRNFKEVPQVVEVPDGYHTSMVLDGNYAIAGHHFIIWYTPNDSGDCGLKPKEHGCFYPA